MNGNPVQDGCFRPSAIGLTLSTTVLLTRQPAMQGFLERPTAPINVTIDGFIADAVAARSPGQASGNLLRRPSLGQALQDFLPKLGLTLELVGSAAGMATQHQLLRALRIVAPGPPLGGLAVALQFTTDGRGASPQNASDATQRFTVCMQTVNLNPLPEAQLLILSLFPSQHLCTVLHFIRELMRDLRSAGGGRIARVGIIAGQRTSRRPIADPRRLL